MREASYSPVLYVPLDDVDTRHVRRSEHHTWCPYKGEASYFDIINIEGAELSDAVWYYDEPFPAVADIKGHVAFYTDRVTVTTADGNSDVQ